MDIIKFSISNPVKVAVGVLLTLLFGTLALTDVPIQMTPDVERPVVSIRTSWQGRSPEEIEKSILMEQEKKLKTLQGLYKMTANASLGQGSIELEFTVGYDMSRAVQETSNRLNEVPRYPEDVDRPVIRAASANTDESIGIGLLQSNIDPNYEMSEFYDYADRFVKPAFERIKGLAEVQVYGGREHEVQIRFDPVVLAQSGVSVDELRAALIADNLNESAGDMANGRINVRVRVLGRYSELEPIRNVIVKYNNGSPVYLRDIATPHLVLQKNTYFNASKGQTSMSIHFRRDTGANVLSVMSEVNKLVKELNKEPEASGFGGGLLSLYKNDRYKIRFRMIYDDSTYINKAVGLVQQNMIEGGILAIIVLLIFLRSVRPTFIVSLAIPISLIGTFVVMYVAGRNINVISLAGLAFAVGMVIDCAVVVLENIDRHLHLGKSPLKAAYDGTREVWGAVLAQTLTTVAVFGPVLTIEEESGQLFCDLAIAVSASVLISLIVAITVIPVSSANWLGDKETKPPEMFLMRLLKSLFGLVNICNFLTGVYSKFIYVVMEKRPITIILRIFIIASISVGAIILIVILTPPASYLPTGNKNLLNGNMQLPPSYTLQQNELVGRRIEQFLKPYWDATTIEEATSIRKIYDRRNNKLETKIAPVGDFYIIARNQGVMMTATSADTELVKPLESVLNTMMNEIPGASGSAQQQSIFGRRGGGSNSVQIEVVGADMGRLRLSTRYLEDELVREFSRSGIRSDPQNYDLNGPEWQLVVDQVRAKELGFGVQSLAYTARAMIDGIRIGDFDFEGDSIDLTLIRDPDIHVTPDEFPMLPIVVRDSDDSRQIIPVGQLFTIVKAEASQQIRRVEQERAIRLTVNPPSDVALETAQKKIMEIVEQCRRDGGLTPDIMIRLAGNADKLSQTRIAILGKWSGLNWDSILSLMASRFFLSLVITYLLMAALFESFLYPMVIMFSVPFAMVGGFIGLSLMRWHDPSQQMDTLTMLGFVLLIGVVVNNAILLVHQALNFMRGFGESSEDIIEAMSYREAIMESVRTRMRPIFMTTTTAIIGMTPLVVKSGAGSELYHGIGSVVVGGLVCSTIFSLLIVPLLLSLMLDIQSAIRSLINKSKNEKLITETI
ncbi:MAG: efflux RND transporter permease subunit [Planctomycetaceae bacterium]|jgi:HAE1 family hydrophobic/amphiphilic exporter-1|nr:efflux RND transporter permease subunit [Planctomycetaceae bacterium]